MIIGVFHPIVVKCEYYFTAKGMACFFGRGPCVLRNLPLPSPPRVVGGRRGCGVYDAVEHQGAEGAGGTRGKGLVSRQDETAEKAFGRAARPEAG